MSTITINFVNFLYEEFLGRSPSETTGDLEGRNFWVDQIDNTPTTSAEATLIFLNNPEFDGFIAPVARLYQASFDRVFDSSGLMFWTGIYRSGATLTQIAQEFLDSPEFTQINGNIDSLTNRQYVEALYRNILGREGEAGGVTFWTGILASGAASRADLLVEFSESDENLSNTASQIDVSLAYEALAGRPPTSAELAAGIALYESSLTGAVSFIESLLSSPAYAGPPAPGYIAPMANDDAFAVGTGQMMALSVLANDVDMDGDPLQISDITQPTKGGTVAISPDGQNVLFTSAGDLKDLTIATFTYTVKDDEGLSDTATVTVLVSDAIKNPLDVIFTTEDEPFVGVLDQPGKNGVFSLVNDINPLLEGTITLDSSTGSFQFNPNGKSEFLNVGQTRALTFTYAVDGVAQNPVTIIVNGENDAPVANAQTFSTPVRTVLTGTLDATDVDDLLFSGDLVGDPSSFRIINGPQNGEASINIITDQARADFKYTPNGNFAGTDTFTYVVTDSQGATDVATVTINVINALPEANPDLATVNTKGTVVIDVLKNDTDADSALTPPDKLTIIDVDGAMLGGGPVEVDGGTVALVGNKLSFTSDGTEGEFVFNYTIQDEFDATDSTTVTVTVKNGGGGEPPVSVTKGGIFTATAGADIFVYDFTVVGGRATTTPDGASVIINGFDPTQDILRFDNLTTETPVSEAVFLATPGVVASENPFANTTAFFFDPNAASVAGSITLTGVQDAALAIITTEII